MLTQVTTAVFSGSAVTLALLYLMQSLVAIQPGAESEPRERWELDWLHDPPQEDPPRTIDFSPPEEIADPPAPPQTHIEPEPSAQRTAVRAWPPRPVSTVITETLNTIPDGPLVAFVRVQPVYPARAQADGIEGYVIVQFNVGADGTVSDVVVVESSDSMFESAAIRAAERFRFKPMVVDGVAVPTYGVQNLFRFRMEQ